MALSRVALESPRAAQSSCRFDCAPSERRHVARRHIPRGLFNASTGERAIASTDGKKLMQHSTSAKDDGSPSDRDPTVSAIRYNGCGQRISGSTGLTKTTQLPTCSKEPTGQKLGGRYWVRNSRRRPRSCTGPRSLADVSIQRIARSLAVRTDNSKQKSDAAFHQPQTFHQKQGRARMRAKIQSFY